MLREDLEYAYDGDQYNGAWIIRQIRASLQARLDGRDLGGDTVIMRLVDEIVEKAVQEAWDAYDRLNVTF